MEDTRTTPTADSIRADAEQITQAQEPPTVTPSPSGHLDSIEAQDARTPRKRKSTTSADTKNRYRDANYKRFEILIAPGDKERLQAAAARMDISPTALIIDAVNAYTGEQILTPKAKNPYI